MRIKLLIIKCHLGKIVVQKGSDLVINLIMFDMSDFDVILGMNFLSKYRVEINCRNKKVWFSLNNGDKFTFGIGHILNMMIKNVE